MFSFHYIRMFSGYSLYVVLLGGKVETTEAAGRLERMLRDPNDHWSDVGSLALRMGAAALRKVPVLEARIAELEKQRGEWYAFWRNHERG